MYQELRLRSLRQLLQVPNQKNAPTSYPVGAFLFLLVACGLKLVTAFISETLVG
jgi:hypothetical protein